MIKNNTMWVKLLGESKDSLNNLLIRLFQTSFVIYLNGLCMSI